MTNPTKPAVPANPPYEPRRLRDHEDGCGLTELCGVFAADPPHPVNGAHHCYDLRRYLTPEEVAREAAGGDPGFKYRCMDYEEDGTVFVGCGLIEFQNGPRNVAGSGPGILDGALLTVLIDRVRCFQAGPFTCDENIAVLGHLEAALGILKKRAQDRAKRGVLGKNEK